jgi:hypothetical protein
VQVGIAAIPFALRRNWSIFLAAVSGTLLAYASASLPHWRKEKYRAHRTKKDFALTRDQGSQHVFIIMGATNNETGESLGLDLEELAAGHAPKMQSTRV